MKKNKEKKKYDRRSRGSRRNTHWPEVTSIHVRDDVVVRRRGGQAKTLLSRWLFVKERERKTSADGDPGDGSRSVVLGNDESHRLDVDPGGETRRGATGFKLLWNGSKEAVADDSTAPGERWLRSGRTEPSWSLRLQGGVLGF
ncbi:hypothetical protein M6B38_329475 [Iris pallida]|uniref:Uncharacterized protein n=1 Tax=Iris pallida TaxID=29817 RepID=A0AAX6EU65_IRIPA|nr:hypothetical protein M6B38_171025 [Iris pallida]KAJ6835930.1 hypothetical protein M6B38_329475 [Iris pallida]